MSIVHTAREQRPSVCYISVVLLQQTRPRVLTLSILPQLHFKEKNLFDCIFIVIIIVVSIVLFRIIYESI
jgi:hypothetical protein